MFKPEKEVPSLELCRKLKELGYPQDKTGYWWGYRAHLKDDEQYVLLFGNKILVGELDWWKAPTCRELGEWLPWYLPELKFLNVERNEDGFHYYYDEETFNGCYIIADTEPNARAEMLIWLVENGYLCFKENKDERRTKWENGQSLRQ